MDPLPDSPASVGQSRVHHARLDPHVDHRSDDYAPQPPTRSSGLTGTAGTSGSVDSTGTTGTSGSTDTTTTTETTTTGHTATTDSDDSTGTTEARRFPPTSGDGSTRAT